MVSWGRREEGAAILDGVQRPQRGRAGLLPVARRRRDVRDVGRDSEASVEVFRLAGRLAVSTIVIEEQAILGFGGHREGIETLLREGARR